MHPDIVPDTDPNQSDTPLDHNPEPELGLASILVSISRRLDALESHFTFQGLDDLTIVMEKRMVTRFKNQRGIQ